MQIHFSQAQGTAAEQMGNPRLLYTGKLEQKDMIYPRIAHSHHDVVEFIYILEGSGEYEIAGRRYPVVKGDLIIYNCGVSHYEFAGNQQPPVLYCAATGFKRPGLPPNHILPDLVSPVFHTKGNQELIRLLLEKMFEIALLNQQQSAMYCQTLFQAFLGLAMEVIEKNHTAQNVERNPTLQFGQDIRNYVDGQPLRSVSVSGVASAFGISESYLARVFKKAYGCSLIEYIIQKRIGEAQSLLISTSLSVMEISACVGYQNQSYFGKVFTEHVGLTPLRYRKLYRWQNTLSGGEPDGKD